MTANSDNITLRSDKSSPLTQAEVDQNFQESKNSIDELGRRVVIRENRGDLKSRDNEVGWYIQLSGLTANDDGRGGLYEVKEPNTGTADDETIIALDNGNQAHLVAGRVTTASGEDETVGDSLNQRVIYKNTLADLQELDTSEMVDGQHFSESGTTRVWNAGAGTFDPITPVRKKAAADFTSDLQDALNEVSSRGGGNVELPYGELGFSGAINIPAGVNLIGMGGGSAGVDSNYGTRLKALSSDAQLVFGNGSGGESRGGTSSGIVLDGAGIAGSGIAPFIHCNLSVQRTFIDFAIVDCAGDALWLDKSQNNTFISLFTSRLGGNGVVLDNGAGGNAFYRAEIARSAGYGVHIRESTGTGPYPRPTHNGFHHSIIERGNTTSTKGMLKVEDGAQNTFEECVFSVNSEYVIDGSDSVIQLEAGELVLVSPRVNGGTIHSLIRQEAGAGMFVHGTAQFRNSPVCYVFNGGYGTFGYARLSNVTELWGGSGNLDEFFTEFSRGLNVKSHDGNSRIARFGHESDFLFRLQISGTGGLEWSDGTNAIDLNLYRHSAGVLRSNQKIVAADGLGGPSSNGAPTGTQTRKIPYYDASGNYVGVIALYDDPE